MKKWEVLSQPSAISHQSSVNSIVDILLKNRGLKTVRQRKEFIKPTPPEKLTLKSLKISEPSVKKAIARVRKAIKNKERIIVYGDYDADGVCATAILWETLYSLKANALPYIPERFSEGYGLNSESIKRLKTLPAQAGQNSKLKLIITVDNGIVADKAVDFAKSEGIDVIITDHHKKGGKTPKAQVIIHTQEIGGAAVAWVFARELKSAIGHQPSAISSLDLVAIGTIADQMPLIGSNRSFVKYGLEVLNKTKRVGLLALIKQAALSKGALGNYEVGFIIAPRLNAMGRLEHALDSLRLLCTKDKDKAKKLALLLGRVNRQRQSILDEVVEHAKKKAEKREWNGVIVLAHQSYHEGVIGLAASKLVEKFYRPAIVLAKGKKFSKASARSISGFNMIETLRTMEGMWVEGGGHPMAAGFTIETQKIDVFSSELDKVAKPLLTEDILTRKLKIDLELEFDKLTWKLLKALSVFEPTGLGNPTPTFITRKVQVLDARTVGADARHLKLVLRCGNKIFDAIAFGQGYLYPKISASEYLDVVYALEENIWNNQRNLQLKIKDIKISQR